MLPEHWSAVSTIAAVQHGLVTYGQVVESGAAPRTRRRALERGLLTPVRRGVYRLGGVPSGVWQPVMAACLAGAPATVASHRAAGGLHRFPGIVAGAVEVTAPRSSRRTLTGVRCHATAELAAEDLVVVRNVPTCAPARTIVDLAATVDGRLLARIVDESYRRGLCSPSEVEAAIARAGVRGRAGLRTLRSIVGDRVVADSNLEATWLRRLAGAGLRPAALQHQVVVGARVLVLDLAWPEHRVGVEVDGWEPHRTRSAWDRDHDKVNAYAEAGWRVLFVTSRTPPADTIRQLRRFLRG
jgi:very-short-patch-repair endonuclease